MAAPTVTYTFSANTTANSGEVNQNFTDLVNYITNRNDGTATWDRVSVSHATNIPLTLNNSTGTQDICRMQDNGSNAFQLFDGGVLTLALQSGFRAYRATSTVTVSASSTTRVQFQTEDFDTKSEYDNATAYKYTVGKAGIYLIMASIEWVAPADNTTLITAITKNGTEWSRSTVVNEGAITQSVPVFDILSLAATDYIDIFVNQNSAGGMDYNFGQGKTWFAGHKIA